MTKVTVTDTFDHLADKVWAAVSDFGGIDKYLRGFSEVKVEGSGLGMDRTLTLPDGQVVERLTWLDNDAMSFSYTIITAPLPFTRYVATVRLAPQGERCGITWEGNFEPNGVSEEEASKLANGVYTSAIKGYKRALAG